MLIVLIELLAVVGLITYGICEERRKERQLQERWQQMKADQSWRQVSLGKRSPAERRPRTVRPARRAEVDQDLELHEFLVLRRQQPDRFGGNDHV